MPLNIDFMQILLHMLNFVILAGALSLLAYKPVSKFLAARREKIAGDIAKNEEDAAELEKKREEYDRLLAEAHKEADELRANAEKEAAKVAAATIDAAKEKAAGIIAAAEKEAEDRKKHILSSAQTEIGELVVSAAEKLLSESASEERTAELYDAFIRTLQDKKD